MTWDRYDDPPVHYWTCETCGDRRVLDALTHTCPDSAHPHAHPHAHTPAHPPAHPHDPVEQAAPRGPESENAPC
jgi:hypothetical protein